MLQSTMAPSTLSDVSKTSELRFDVFFRRLLRRLMPTLTRWSSDALILVASSSTSYRVRSKSFSSSSDVSEFRLAMKTEKLFFPVGGRPV